jgi:hypothetical protein
MKLDDLSMKEILIQLTNVNQKISLFSNCATNADVLNNCHSIVTSMDAVKDMVLDLIEKIKAIDKIEGNSLIFTMTTFVESGIRK